MMTLQINDPSATSGIPLQLDWLLLVVLFDHISRRQIRGHLRLWPVAHQMGSYCQGKSHTQHRPAQLSSPQGG